MFYLFNWLGEHLTHYFLTLLIGFLTRSTMIRVYIPFTLCYVASAQRRIGIVRRVAWSGDVSRSFGRRSHPLLLFPSPPISRASPPASPSLFPTLNVMIDSGRAGHSYTLRDHSKWHKRDDSFLRAWRTVTRRQLARAASTSTRMGRLRRGVKTPSMEARTRPGPYALISCTKMTTPIHTRAEAIAVFACA